jgi:hypothetical protein
VSTVPKLLESTAKTIRMRFEVKYPTGTPHEVELQGTLVTLGRDPACDLVLSDAKASRRHAVIEAGPQGLAIRDTGSANGVYVNAKKVERASLQPGDLVRIGEVVIKILAEEITGTVVMPPEELEPAPGGAPPPAAPPAAAASAPAAPKPSMPAPKAAPAANRAGPRAVSPPARVSAAVSSRTDGAVRSPGRPLMVTLLASLWLLSLLLYLGSGVFGAARSGWTTPAAIVGAVVSLFLAALSAVMAFGLWTLKSWARFLQIGIAVLGLFVCPFSLASATVLFYMLREDARLYFSGRAVPGSDDQARGTELTFSLSLLGMVALGTILATAGLWYALPRIAP